MRLHGYFRSAASWRVRIALNLKGIKVDGVSHHLRRGEQHLPQFLQLNPQGFVPALELDDGTVLTQSLAIMAWLDEVHPQPALLPSDAKMRAKVRAFSLVLAADTHPLQNLAVLAKLRSCGLDEPKVQAWAGEVNARGLAVCEQLAGQGRFAFGEAPGLADICLVPQLGNARRFGVDVTRFPRLLAIEAHCNALAAFHEAAPDNQPDAE